MASELAEELETLFLVKDYLWSIDGERRFPTSEDIEQVLDRAKSALYTEPDGTQIEVGRLIIKKRQGHLDVFITLGEIT